MNYNIQFPFQGCRNAVVAGANDGAPPYQYVWFYDDMGYTSLPDNVQFVSTNYYLCDVNIPLREFLYLFVQDSCGQSAFMEITSEMLQHREKSTNSFWDVVLHPNPTTGNITIQSSEFKVQRVDVYDIYGKLLRTVNTNSISTDINVSDLAAGLYAARIYTEKGVRIKRFVKQ